MTDLHFTDPTFPEFTSGRIEIDRPNTVIIWASNPVIVGYLNVFDPTKYRGALPVDVIQKVDFTAGRVPPFIPFAKDIVLKRGVSTFEGGSIHITDVGLPDTGALSDWAAWPNGLRDPAEFYVASVSTPASGNVGAAWTRPSAVFGVSRGLKTYPRVAFLGVGARFTTVLATFKQHLSEVMLEPADIAGSYPSAYTPARQVQVVVKPDRLNYSPNPGFEVSTANWAVTGAGVTLTRTAGPPASGGSAFAGVVAVPTAVAATLQHTVSGLLVGRHYTISIDGLTAALGLGIVLAPVSGATRLGGNTWATSVTDDPKGFQRLSMTFLATATTAVLQVTLPALTGGYTFTADNTLVEEGDLVKPYFDASIGPEYLWETGGTPGLTRSYFYKNRPERYAAMKRLLNQHVPMGIGVADPVFATLPLD